MKKKRTYIYITLGIILSIICCNQIVIQQTKKQIYSEIAAIPHMEYALVLGAAKNGKNGLNPYFKYRMDATLKLYNANKIDTIIVSGDNHIAGYNETEDMANYLIVNGVPKSKIIQDYAGFRTLDSVVRAKKVFGATSVCIISQKFHNQRALYIANHYKMKAVAFNAQDVKSGFNVTHFREYFAKCLVILDLKFFNRQPKFL